MDWKVRVSDQISSGAVDVYIFREISEEQIEVVTKFSDLGMEVTVIPKGQRMRAVMNLDWNCQKLLQAISDGLFNFGIRPTQEPVLKNEMTATKYHLEDVREILSIALGQKEGGRFGTERKDGDGIACRPSG